MWRYTVFLWLLIPAVAIAQDEDLCRALAREAWATLDAQCATVVPGLACYGVGGANVIYVDDTEPGRFQEPGDRVEVNSLGTLQLAVPNPGTDEWGLVKAAFAPVEDLESRVTVVLLGGVEIENQGVLGSQIPIVAMRVTFETGANLRAEPAEDADLLGAVRLGETVLATGRLPGNEWVRVRTGDGDLAWITSTALDTENIRDLRTAEPDDDLSPEVLFAPFQAFSIAAAPAGVCGELPPGGALIQSPEDGVPIRMLINDQPLQMPPGSTVFVTAGEDELLRVNALEGTVDMSSFVELVFDAGQGVAFREGEAAVPRAYDYDSMARLPIEALPRQIFIPLDFGMLLEPPQTDPLAGLTMEASPCTIAAPLAPANLREAPESNARVRHVMQIGQRALADGRIQGGDGALWWRLAEDVWVSSNAVAAVGRCGDLPLVPADWP